MNQVKWPLCYLSVGRVPGIACGEWSNVGVNVEGGESLRVMDGGQCGGRRGLGGLGV